MTTTKVPSDPSPVMQAELKELLAAVCRLRDLAVSVTGGATPEDNEACGFDKDTFVGRMHATAAAMSAATKAIHCDVDRILGALAQIG
jgi:hypothetical protein